MVQHAGEEICRTLKTAADPAHLPLLFHCSHGKDRTGLFLCDPSVNPKCVLRALFFLTVNDTRGIFKHARKTDSVTTAVLTMSDGCVAFSKSHF